MRKTLLNAKHLRSEEAALRFLEQLRWPNGIRCPRCEYPKVYRMARKGKVNKQTGKRGPDREILKCAGCRKQFSAIVGTVFEDSHLPLTLWLQAMQLMCSSKKGISSHQLHRMLDVTYKTAWFLTHRIRHAMGDLITTEKMGGRATDGVQYKVVEVDETYIGTGKRSPRRGSRAHKIPVVALVERGGRVRSKIMPKVTANNLKAAIRTNVKPDSFIITDSFKGYHGLDREVNVHETVNHYKKEYVRGQIHTNTIEGYFSLLKRGLTGTFHHVSQKHLQRYLDEFSFRYNNRTETDAMLAALAVKATDGKRLQYQ